MDESKRLRALLDERGIEYTILVPSNYTAWKHDGTHCTVIERFDKLYLETVQGPLTPEQAIAATVGNGTDLSKRLREVHGLHAFAELFGFDWSDESDWSWHDVACAMADAIDATVGVGTCKDVCASVSEFTCSECGFNCELTSWISLFDGDDGRHRHHHHGTPNFCPNCGAKVVDE